MKNRIEVLARLKKDGLGIVADALQKAKSAEDRARVLEDAGVEIKVDGGFEAVWQKTVRIIPENGEDVVIEEPAAPEQAMADEPMDEDEGEKSAPAPRRQPSAAEMMRIYKGASDESRGKGPAIRSAREATVKTYTHRAKSGVRNPQTGKAYVFTDGDEAEAFGAFARLAAFGQINYAQKGTDLKIVGKSLNTIDPTTGSALVPDDFSAQIIANLNQFGAARRAIGVTAMSRDVMGVPRRKTRMQFARIGEGNALTAQNNPQTDLVELVAHKAGGLCQVTRELLNDSAVSVADLIADAVAEGLGEYEDQEFITGTNGFENIIAAGASAAVLDTESTGWGSITPTEIQEWIGGLGHRAWRNGRVSIITSAGFYYSVLRNLAFGAGGATPGEIIAGVGPKPDGADGLFDGIPVFFTDVINNTYGSGNDFVAYVGAFDAACKLGEVRGGLEIAQSDQRYFDSDLIAFRALTREAFNIHDVAVEARPMVRVLQD